MDLADDPHRGYDTEKDYRFEIRTDADRFEVHYTYFDLGGGGEYSLRKRGSDGLYQDVPCYGFNFEVEAERHFMRWSAPRSCLGRPTWIRMGADVFDCFCGADDFYDDALTTGVRVDEWQRRTTLGPRLRRP